MKLYSIHYRVLLAVSVCNILPTTPEIAAAFAQEAEDHSVLKYKDQEERQRYIIQLARYFSRILDDLETKDLVQCVVVGGQTSLPTIGWLITDEGLEALKPNMKTAPLFIH